MMLVELPLDVIGEMFAFVCVKDWLTLRFVNQICKLGVSHLWSYSTKLNLQNMYFVTDKLITLLSDGMPRLRFLSLSNCIKVTDKALTSVAANCPLLQTINIDNCHHVSDEGVLQLSSCQNMQELRAGRCHRLGDRGIAELTKLPDMQRLSLTQCISLTAASFHSIAENCAASLLELDLTCCLHVGSAALKVICEKCKFLETLVARNSLCMTTGGFKCVLAECQNLTWLDASCCEISNEECWVAFEQRAANLSKQNKQGQEAKEGVVKTPQSLKHLDLSLNCDLSTAIAGIAACAPQLEYLDISGCLEAAGFEKGLHQLSELTVFRGKGMSWFTDHDLQRLAAGSKGLQEIDVGGCPLISDSGVVGLAKECAALEKLGLAHCREVSDAAVLAVLLCCEELRQLKLQGCSNVSEVVVQQIPESYPLVTVSR
eukprot:TRINITY_DN84642_c0_g1_i1.p1 TRINITY_DN84642_c0_g1~~TRINITY_DN84642_c0_g1_i1.p1  ORF type:complete len:430 (-),score=21.69 TRINITY_DN84642_c0_g1_i1:364-1653(-)